MSLNNASRETYYDVLEINADAQLIDVKKAYRRLALKHHPDRNNGSIESAEHFKKISAAYEVLSDPEQRAAYDDRLKSNGSSAVGVYGDHQHQFHSHYSRQRDPFSMFDDLFRHDPFFHEAFRDLDDEFTKRFQEDERQSSKADGRVGWVGWILNKCGIDFQMTTYSSTSDGGFSASTYSYGAPRQGRASRSTNKSAKNYVDESGRRITIRSMEQNGNKIEDKYVDDTLQERKVNGVAESLQDLKVVDRN